MEGETERERERQKRWPIRLPKVLHHVGVLASFLTQGIEVVEPPAPVRQELYNTQSVVKESLGAASEQRGDAAERIAHHGRVRSRTVHPS
jgi:hypothetical protein